MIRRFVFITVSMLVGLPAGMLAQSNDACVACHADETPQMVTDWRASRHAALGIGCAACHGTHASAADLGNLHMPTPETCGTCHAERVEQFSKGKHALAWAALTAMPTFHAMPVALREGMKGCGGCHKIGLKSEQDLLALKDAGAGYGRASCDGCHTRHTFSVEEARRQVRAVVDAMFRSEART